MGVVGKVAPLIRSSGSTQSMYYPQLSVCWQMTATQTPMMDTTITANDGDNDNYGGDNDNDDDDDINCNFIYFEMHMF